jgi:hypothetical protein
MTKAWPDDWLSLTAAARRLGKWSRILTIRTAVAGEAGRDAA